MKSDSRSRIRWVVRRGDGQTVADILRRAGADEGAVEDGRVFVGRRRVRTSAEPVTEDDVVEIAQPRESSIARVLLHQEDLVAVDKPTGVPTIGDHSGAAHSLLAMTARAIGVDPSRLHPTSRLDRDVSGVVIFALTKGAAERLLLARAEGRYERRYVALAPRPPVPAKGTWDSPIGRAADPRKRTIGGKDPIPAWTSYASCAATPGAALLAVAPRTGRTHQIRVHASAAGVPLIGDRTYGGVPRVTLPTGRVIDLRRIALHAARVTVPASRGNALSIAAPVPDELAGLWVALGGEPAAWQVAESCAVE